MSHIFDECLLTTIHLDGDLLISTWLVNIEHFCDAIVFKYRPHHIHIRIITHVDWHDVRPHLWSDIDDIQV